MTTARQVPRVAADVRRRTSRGAYPPPLGGYGLLWRSAIIAVCILAITGCAVGPNYNRAKVELQQSYGELGKIPEAESHNSRAVGGTPITEWWTTFHDPELNHLVDEALRENYDLRIATARIRQARFQRSIAAADLFPEIAADAGYNHARGSKNVVLPFGGGGSVSAGGANPARKSAADPPGDSSSDSRGSGGSAGNNFNNQLSPFGKGGLPGVTSSLYQVGFDSNWELDIFGGTRRRIEAATADLAAAVEGRRAMAVTLLAEVARDYLELRGTQQRLAIARENLASQKEILELTSSRRKNGLGTELDVSRAAAQVATTASMIPPLEMRSRQTMHALSTLLAKPPTALSAELEKAETLPPVPPEVPVGLPSQLLLRRPDIRRAERRIAAATARIGSAKADLFPKFALTGGIGLDSSSAEKLFDWQSRYFLISPTVTWTVFDAGRILSNVALQKANRQETVLQYRNTILSALREVEDALVAYAFEQSRSSELQEALHQSQDSLMLARQQYEHGLVDFLTVLDTQRNVFAAQDALAQSRESAATDLVALYKALGGGWQPQGNDK